MCENTDTTIPYCVCVSTVKIKILTNKHVYEFNMSFTVWSIVKRQRQVS